jgi:hypothetical protein
MRRVVLGRSFRTCDLRFWGGPAFLVMGHAAGTQTRGIPRPTDVAILPDKARCVCKRVQKGKVWTGQRGVFGTDSLWATGSARALRSPPHPQRTKGEPDEI